MWTADQLVFFNKSASNKRTGNRKFKWAPIGKECKVSCLFKKLERWSILPALLVNRYLSYLIYQGSITAEIFELFLEQQVLPYCTLYPGLQFIFILDNVSIHKSAQLCDLYKKHSILFIFLPLYSPDYNPIKAIFKDLKVWVKRNY